MIRPRVTAWLIIPVLCALSIARPVDHDESQYVAAAVLTAHGFLPYRDYAYLQTPLQPFVFAPIALIAGTYAWLALRLANALLGAVTMFCVYRAARTAGAGERMAMIATGAFACCDIFLFSIAVARNDALPAALFSASMIVIALIERDGATRKTAALAGLMLAAATAGKISYALPAIAYGCQTLTNVRMRRPVWIAMGAMPVIIFVAWTFALAPEGFWFGTMRFPSVAPAEYYASQPFKLSLSAKAIDTSKFLLLGPALVAALLVVRDGRRRGIAAFNWLICASLIAALLPFPTWRQYLLPVLPPLFVRLSLAGEFNRRACVLLLAFALIGLYPSLRNLTTDGRTGFSHALHDGRAVRRVLNANRIDGPIGTLSPQFLPMAGAMPAADFATGPFYFRSDHLLDPATERRLRLVSHLRPRTGSDVVLVGLERTLDDQLAAAARRSGFQAIPVPGTAMTLFVRVRQ